MMLNCANLLSDNLIFFVILTSSYGYISGLITMLSQNFVVL